MEPATRPVLFPSPAKVRAWFEKHHATKRELWTVYYKQGSGKRSASYKEVLDEALCFGWIDGIAKGIDGERYMQRWTPRKERSYWSAVNVAKAQALIAAGRMAPPGLAAFEKRDASAQARYSFENRPRELPRPALARLKAHEAAWAFWKEQPPGYRRTAVWHVVSAKREPTREKRLAALIAACARGERIAQLAGPKGVKRARPPAAPAKRRAASASKRGSGRRR